MKKFALVALVAVALAFPAVALAKKIKVSGGVVGDKDARVSLTVSKKKNGNTQIKNFKAVKINVRCGKQTGNFIGPITITGPGLSVNRNGTFKARLPNVSNPKEKLRISGKVKNGGRKVSGNIKTNKITLNKNKCDIPKQHYELSK